MKGIAAAALIIVVAGTSYAQTGDPGRGSTLYHTTYKCTACHGDPPGSNPVNDQFLIKQGTPLGIANAIVLVPEMSLQYRGILDVNAVDLADLSAYLAQFAAPPPPPPTSPTADVIEYYYAAWDHYFITPLPAEIAALDNGTFPGWVRTGFQFKAYLPASATGASASPASRIAATAPPADTDGMCRFFSTAFAPKSSHFYTYSADECALVKTYPQWSYEGIVMYVYPANPDGTCPAGQIPVWRLYNNGMGGAPNHRYTADPGQRDLMVAKGYALEGNGPGFAFMCTPA